MELDPEALTYEVKRAVHASVEKNKESVLRLVMRDIAAEMAAYSMQVDSSGLPTHPLTRMLCIEIEKEIGAQICNVR